MRVEPADVVFEVPGVQPLLREAERAGIRWPTVCGGQGTCRTCYLRVRAGGEHLSEIGVWEADGLRDLGLANEQGTVRLACQVVVSGDVVVHKPGVRTGSN
ncbi:MAG TPA: 2Fe-2S iron-sulfur cluster-binding protein [Acidimicrobiales bacterium]